MIEDYAEEEFELEEFDSDDPEDEEEDRVAAVSQLVAQWEREAGVELTEAEFNHIGTQVDLYGLTPDQAYASTAPGRFEAGFEATVEAVQAEQGRKLLDSEVDAMWEAAERAANDPSIETDAVVWAEARKATTDLLATPEGRAEYIGQRLSVPQEREQPSGVRVDEDGDETPSFNLDNRSEREAAIDLALSSGEAVATHDNSDLQGDDE